MKLPVSMGGQLSNILRIMKISLEIEGKNSGSINYKGPDCIDLAVAYLNSIEADEVRVRIARDDGAKADAEFEGEFPVVSATKFILSVSGKNAPIHHTAAIQEIISGSGTLSIKERLEMFLRFEYPGIWFSSLDVKRQYENVYGKIGLSTVSTYLARMCHENILIRRGNRNQREYHFKEQSILGQNMQVGLVK
ncbi:MAG: hypothetical protein OIN87_04120 [Candidatus Methanoperedens sp.]|nr:hypothetical protein [Candidatus Methanoperedens sp.]